MKVSPIRRLLGNRIPALVIARIKDILTSDGHLGKIEGFLKTYRRSSGTPTPNTPAAIIHNESESTSFGIFKQSVTR
jgi:hypothetical protein